MVKYRVLFVGYHLPLYDTHQDRIFVCNDMVNTNPKTQIRWRMQCHTRSNAQHCCHFIKILSIYRQHPLARSRFFYLLPQILCKLETYHQNSGRLDLVLIRCLSFYSECSTFHNTKKKISHLHVVDIHVGWEQTFEKRKMVAVSGHWPYACSPARDCRHTFAKLCWHKYFKYWVRSQWETI